MRKLLLSLLPALLLLAACEGDKSAPADTAGTGIATVNGEAITEAQLNTYAERRTGQDPSTLQPQVREQLISELVNIQLLAQAAERDNLDEKSPLKEQLAFQRETAMADAAMTQYLERNPVDEAAVRAEYDQRKDELGGKEYKARHILVEDEAKAQQLIAELEGGADFTALAKEHSTEPGADQSGGDLGWFSPAQMVPPFAAAVTSMQPGERSQEPVQTQFGWHVISVEDVREVPPPPFEQIAPQIERFLTNQRIQNYINELRANAEISQPTSSDAPAAGEEPGDAGATENENSVEETESNQAVDETQPEA